jgi:hypothetical protein
MAPRRLRYVAPFAVAGLVAAGATVPSLDAGASPRLPSLGPAALVAKVLRSHVSAFSGNVAWTANLGLPSLGELTSGAGQDVPAGSAFSPTSLLSGTHDFTLWVDGARRQRVAAAGQLSEADLVRRGDQAWTWDSSTQRVTHYLFARPATADASGVAGSLPSPAPGGHPGAAHRYVPLTAGGDPGAVTPAGVAEHLLTGLRSHQTSVSVSPPVRVAGHAAYELVLAPTGVSARHSTVSAVRIAVDAANGFPLRVGVFPANGSAPAFQVGFTWVHFRTPAASRFAAPHGTATVTETVRGPGAPMTGSHGRGGGARTLGAGWATVGVFARPSGTQGSVGRFAAELGRVSTAVSGSWGSGRLLRSSILDALLLPDGTVLAGFVTPATLEADAAALGR